MTKRERAQVVELLRCAADVESIYDATSSHCDTVDGWIINATDAVCARHCLAIRLRERVDSHLDYRAQCLEAAQRVEDEEWP